MIDFEKLGMEPMGSRNDVAANDVDGIIGNKTWCKCEYRAPTETSIESICYLEIPEICKPRL